MVAEFGILVPEDAAVSEFKMPGEEGADAKFGGGADDGEGRRFNPYLAGPFPLTAAANRKTLRPAEVFAVVGMDEFRFPVIGGVAGRMRIQEETFMAFSRRPRSKPRHCKG
ncbi:MAG: hypothetical protein EBZ44_03860, partial [Verrucomicrobia bacterium]|nr:hypothetical protein [Verrucomicrobiota bacterium]